MENGEFHSDPAWTVPIQNFPNFGEVNSNDLQDDNWEPMEMKGSLRMPRR